MFAGTVLLPIRLRKGVSACAKPVSAITATYDKARVAQGMHGRSDFPAGMPLFLRLLFQLLSP